MFADDFVGITETPEGLQKRTEEALESPGNEELQLAFTNVRYMHVTKTGRSR